MTTSNTKRTRREPGTKSGSLFLPRPGEKIVDYLEVDRQSLTLRAGNAASRIRSNLSGRTNKFGCLQAPCIQILKSNAGSRRPAFFLFKQIGACSV